MRAVVFFILAFFLTLASTAQEWKSLSDTMLKGRVYVERNGKIYIPKAHVSIIGTDGSSNETTTDKDGYYYFTNKELSMGHSYVITYGQADYSKGSIPFLNKTDKLTFKDYTGQLPMVMDKEVYPHRGCTIGSYLVFFKENSGELDSIYKRYVDGLYDNLMWRQEEALDYPGLSGNDIVINVMCRAHSLEEEPDQLAQSRGEAIANRLVNRGVSSDKIVIINKSDSVPNTVTWWDEAFEPGDKLDKEFSIKITDPKEKEIARSLNSYAIIWFDYREN